VSSTSRLGCYVVAGYRPWNRLTFDETIVRFPGEWHYVGSHEELTVEMLRKVNPQYVFFLHWSWKVPMEIINQFTCVNFHMTDLPYGRGGSPLQNLIMRGHAQTKLSALQMTEEMDGGPVYLKEDLSLEGNAENIYRRASELSAQMIHQLITNEITPMPQEGIPVIFKRRQPHESELPEITNIEQMYDFIRMLDAEGYPRAHVVRNGFKFEFSKPVLQAGSLVAQVAITGPEDKEKGS